ncbi:MAG: hypothetical protein M0006_12050 [Magnetospirillum sp.]|nr:hypothetical protein [Magnetospirillum sp.]
MPESLDGAPLTRHMLGDVAAGAYIGGIAAVAQATSMPFVLFPELGALSHDILTRPRGTWARAPVLLVVTPVATGALGIMIARTMAYGLPAIFLAVGSAILVIRLLRSPIAPAISAGLLPVVLGVTSWWYPPAIVLGTGVLAALALARRRLFPDPPESRAVTDMLDDLIEAPPFDYSWIPYFLVFLGIDAVLAEAAGWRFLLFPPLVVIAFEMFAHAAVCPWAERPLLLPVACAATGAAGILFVGLLGATPLAAVASMASGIVILRAFRLRVPPALAVGLLPSVIDHPDSRFPLAVGVGTLLLTVSFLLWRRVASRRRLQSMPE